MRAAVRWDRASVCSHASSAHSYLQRAGQRPLAVPLRMLEVFLSTATYTASRSDGSTHIKTLLQFLVQQGEAVWHYKGYVAYV